MSLFLYEKVGLVCVFLFSSYVNNSVCQSLKKALMLLRYLNILTNNKNCKTARSVTIFQFAAVFSVQYYFFKKYFFISLSVFWKCCNLDNFIRIYLVKFLHCRSRHLHCAYFLDRSEYNLFLHS